MKNLILKAYKLLLVLGLSSVSVTAYSEIKCSSILSVTQQELTDAQKAKAEKKSRLRTVVFKYDSKNEVSQNAVVVRSDEVLPWYKRLRLPFAKKKQSIGERYFSDSIKLWSPVFESIEARTNTRIDLSVFKSYKIRNHKVGFEHWVSFDVVAFINTEGEKEFYFFSGEAPSGKGLDPEDVTEVVHKEGGTVYQHMGRTYGRLEDLDIFKLQVGFHEELSSDKHPYMYTDYYAQVDHMRQADGPKAIVLPLSKTISLKVVDSGRINSVEVVNRDNSGWFIGHKESTETLSLYNEWRGKENTGDADIVLDTVFSKHKREIDDLIKELDRSDLTVLKVEAVIIKLQLKIREISRLQGLAASYWMEEAVRDLLRRNQYLTPSAQGMDRALDEVTMLFRFKTVYLYKLNELFLYFDTEVESLKEVFSEGNYEQVLAEGFRNDLNSEVREAVRLTVEGAYSLERSRLDQLQSLVQRLSLTSSTLDEKDLLEINRSLEKLLLGGERPERTTPGDIDIDIPVLEFDFLMKHRTRKRPFSGMMIMI